MNDIDWLKVYEENLSEDNVFTVKDNMQGNLAFCKFAIIRTTGGGQPVLSIPNARLWSVQVTKGATDPNGIIVLTTEGNIIYGLYAPGQAMATKVAIYGHEVFSKIVVEHYEAGGSAKYYDVYLTH